jgi:septal ring factor EnvC (AmiA/AmiB activator)
MQTIKDLLNKIPQPWRLIVFIIAICAAIAGIIFLFGQMQSCGYNRAQTQFDKEKEQWQQQRAVLESQAKEHEAKIAELEPKALAYEAAAKNAQRIDASLADKINQITEDSKNAQQNADVTVDCSVRAQRICDLFRASDKKFDCSVVFNQCSR